MPRPRKHRVCRAFRGDRVFKPRSVPMSALRTIHLDLAELEALRLCDVEDLTQQEASARMAVSRGTVQRLLSDARRKVATALVSNAALVIGESGD